jgi:hypothetical protein
MAGAGSKDVVHDAQCLEILACRMTLEAASTNGMMRIISLKHIVLLFLMPEVHSFREMTPVTKYPGFALVLQVTL